MSRIIRNLVCIVFLLAGCEAPENTELTNTASRFLSGFLDPTAIESLLVVTGQKSRVIKDPEALGLVLQALDEQNITNFEEHRDLTFVQEGKRLQLLLFSNHGLVKFSGRFDDKYIRLEATGIGGRNLVRYYNNDNEIMLKLIGNQ